MGVHILVLGVFLQLFSYVVSEQSALLSSCPYGHGSEGFNLDTDHADRDRRNAQTFQLEVRPSVNEPNLDVFLKDFLPKYNINPSSVTSGWLDLPSIEKQPLEPIKCGLPPQNCLNDSLNLHYRSIDGSCNNLLYPEFGIAINRYRRLLPPRYVDQQVQAVPNARLISLSLYGETTKTDSYRTLAAMQWGQFVAHDISQLTTKGAPKDCCAESNHPQCKPIALPRGGPIAYNTGKSCLSFARAISDADAICPKSDLPYSEKLSVVTSYLDLSSLYGNSPAQNRRVRLFKGGLLRTSYVNGQHWVPVSHNENGECGSRSECYSMPDRRNRFTPTIALLHTILLREHNRLAEQLALLNPAYNDERLYQEARKINIAQFQKITYYDWVPLFLGSDYAQLNGLIYPEESNEFVNDYDESVNPSAYAEFSAAAFRYSHTQIPGWFSLVAPNRSSNQTLRLSDYFERPETIQLLSSSDNFDALIRGLATQLQKRSDANVDVEIKHYFNRKEFQEYGADLKSFDIQRGRDFGLASYNDVREFCGLRRANYWEDFAAEISAEKISLLRKLYASPDDVELTVGGSLEFHAPEALYGPTMLCIVGKQLLNSRRSDRFFFERDNHLSGFSRTQLAEIRKASLAGLFCSNAHYLHYIQANVFVFPNGRNALLNCNDIPQVDLSKWQDFRAQIVN
ncbi:peroxidase [Drosophila tropicalis]|uniref:peroxidase n=1 Tax=Drosophila tropicalis TaxID=46794 RepID=UPI0035ABD6A8